MASVAGFAGQPITLVGVLDDDTGVLVIAKQVSFSEAKLPDFAMVSNLDLPEVDYRFIDADMKQAIAEFFAGQSQGMVDIVEAIGRYNPANKIEMQGVDANGPKYAVAPDVDNGQIAVLAMVRYANKQKAIGSAVRGMSELAEFYGIQTI
jgi:hypothetical protein